VARLSRKFFPRSFSQNFPSERVFPENGHFPDGHNHIGNPATSSWATRVFPRCGRPPGQNAGLWVFRKWCGWRCWPSDRAPFRWWPLKFGSGSVGKNLFARVYPNFVGDCDSRMPTIVSQHHETEGHPTYRRWFHLEPGLYGVMPASAYTRNHEFALGGRHGSRSGPSVAETGGQDSIREAVCPEAPWHPGAVAVRLWRTDMPVAPDDGRSVRRVRGFLHPGPGAVRGWPRGFRGCGQLPRSRLAVGRPR